MIDIQDMSFRYSKEKTVLSQLDLHLSAGSIYGLLGKNGTGKSTLLYLIAGLLRPTVGTACYDGVATCERHAETLSELFLVPEEFELPAMTLDRYVALLSPFYPRFSREVLDRCLTDFELPLSLHLQKLSMGQKKKVMMSFALAAQTCVLLMDEPTNGLDIPSKSQFRKVVASCMQDDRLILISTHQVHDVEQLLDHILILSESGLLLNDAVASLTDRYACLTLPVGSEEAAIVYEEPSLQGRQVIARRTAGMSETPLNLELLFNAVTKGIAL